MTSITVANPQADQELSSRVAQQVNEATQRAEREVEEFVTQRKAVIKNLHERQKRAAVRSWLSWLHAD